MNHNDERDYAEEAFNRRTMETGDGEITVDDREDYDPLKHGLPEGIDENFLKGGQRSFTAMSDEAIKATIKAFEDSRDIKYPMELNASDFAMFMWVLKMANDSDVENDPFLEPIADWAGSFASGIASTLGIEMI